MDRPTRILTLRLDDVSQAFFEEMRQRHFPPERNQIPAHLTLFHQLPACDEMSATLVQETASRQSFPLKVSGLRSLGRGVAYLLTSPALLDLHRRLSTAFADDLIPQDRQRFQPHIVIQNKVTGEQARTLLADMQPAFSPFTIQGTGLDLWAYLGGPWKHLQLFPFGGGQQG